MQNVDVIIKFLSYLGLDFDESKLYLTLLNKGGMTVLEISKATKISRTNVYRIIDRLKESGFVEEVISSSPKKTSLKKRYIHPVGMHKLEMLVKEQESKADFLRNIFPEIATIIPASNSISQPDSKVLFYKGMDGIKQMIWNLLNAKIEICGYTFSTMNSYLDNEFISSWKREFSFKRLKLRDLISDTSIIKNSSKEFQERFETRFISPDILEVNQNTFIYDDTLAYLAIVEGELFGVELHNKSVSKTQKQLFEAVWRLGTEI